LTRPAGSDPIKLAKVDWFADGHHISKASGLTLVGGLAERTVDHVAGADMFIRIDALENCQMTLAPLRDIDRKQMNSEGTHANSVAFKHVVLHF